MKSKKALIALGTLMLLAMGCGKKNDDSVNVASRSVNRGGALQTTANQSAYYTGVPGKVYSDPAYAEAFSEAMRRLLSASIDEKYIGSIGINDVVLKGYIEFDGYGALVAGKSVMSLEIRDSFVGQNQDGQTVKPMVITLPATGGQITGGQARLTFGDSYGTITLNGTYTNGANGQYSGTLSFQNNDGGSGEGLSFQITTCGFFRCY